MTQGQGPQGYEQQPPQGFGPPPGWQGYPQQPPPKKKSTPLWVWALIAIPTACIGIGVIGAAAGGGKKANEAHVTTTPVGESLPWFSQVASTCAAYKAAPNEIKKSAIFKQHEAFLAQTSVSSARGKLKILSTNQGGSDLTLAVQLGEAEFKTESLFAPIKQGTPVYDAASELKVGQCVTFSTGKLKAASVMEQSQVCDLDYFAEFTSIGGC